MTSLTDTQVVTASGGLVELGYTERTTTVTITSTTPGAGTDLSIPVTFVADGSPVLVEFYCPDAYSSAYQTDYAVIDWYLDGTYRGYLGANQTPNNGGAGIYCQYRFTPSAGSHTIAIKPYKNGAGTVYFQAGSGTSGYAPMFLRVSKIVEATQWPAVTTGTIICTSSTRPASPFEGQKIYETDTDRELTYDSSAWVQTTSLGGWSTWTPQLYQNGNLTSTINHARYTRIGDTAIVQAKVSATQAGTAGQEINILNLPYSAEAAADYTTIGNAYYWDGTYRWLLEAETLPTATSIAFGYDSAPFSAYGGGRFGASPSKAVASGHFVSFALTYEIA